MDGTDDSLLNHDLKMLVLHMFQSKLQISPPAAWWKHVETMVVAINSNLFGSVLVPVACSNARPVIWWSSGTGARTGLDLSWWIFTKFYGRMMWGDARKLDTEWCRCTLEKRTNTWIKVDKPEQKLNITDRQKHVCMCILAVIIEHLSFSETRNLKASGVVGGARSGHWKGWDSWKLDQSEKKPSI